MPLTSLSALKAQHEMRIAQQASSSVAGPDADRAFARNPAQESAEDLFITVAGTTYPVFVLGVDNPDDIETERYVP